MTYMLDAVNYLSLGHERLSVAKVPKEVGSPATGATSIFIGTTRNNFDGKRVVLLEYEAYEKMALKEMRVICTSARQKWPDIIGIAIYHRLGKVSIGEASVIIAVSSAHRRDAIEACHFLINELKATVPIWKKEVYEDGSTWKENKEFKFAREENKDKKNAKEGSKSPKDANEKHKDFKDAKEEGSELNDAKEEQKETKEDAKEENGENSSPPKKKFKPAKEKDEELKVVKEEDKKAKDGLVEEKEFNHDNEEK